MIKTPRPQKTGWSPKKQARIDEKTVRASTARFLMGCVQGANVALLLLSVPFLAIASASQTIVVAVHELGHYLAYWVLTWSPPAAFVLGGKGRGSRVAFRAFGTLWVLQPIATNGALALVEMPRGLIQRTVLRLAGHAAVLAFTAFVTWIVIGAVAEYTRKSTSNLDAFTYWQVWAWCVPFAFYLLEVFGRATTWHRSDDVVGVARIWRDAWQTRKARKLEQMRCAAAGVRRVKILSANKGGR